VGEPGPARSGGGGPGSQVARRVGDGPIDDLVVLRALLTSPFTMLPVSRPDDFAARPSPAAGPGEGQPSGSTFPTDLLHETPDGVSGVFLGAGAPWGGPPSGPATTPARPRPTHGGVEAAGSVTSSLRPVGDEASATADIAIGLGALATARLIRPEDGAMSARVTQGYP
jgi:hypothetical protein